jgi:hypothetical protein
MSLCSLLNGGAEDLPCGRDLRAALLYETLSAGVDGEEV